METGGNESGRPASMGGPGARAGRNSYPLLTMRSLRRLLLLSLASLLVSLAACKGGGTNDTGVVEVRDMLLTHISADEATKLLRKKIGGPDTTVSPNPRNNSVIVTGTMASIKEAEELLKEIDVPKK